MKQLTLPFKWDVNIFKHPEDKNPIFTSNVEAVSPRQSVLRGARRQKVKRYDIETSVNFVAPSNH